MRKIRQQVIQQILWGIVALGILTCSLQSLGRSTSPSRRAPSSVLGETRILRKKPGRIVQAELLVAQGELTDKSTQEMISMLKGFQTLISDEKNPEKKAKLLLSEAGTHLALARQYRAKGKRLTSTEKRNEQDASRRVVARMSSLTPDEKLPATIRSRAAYYAGLALLNMNLESEAQRHFRQSIEIDPSATHSQALSLFLAEQAFEQDRYQDSLEIFKTHFKKYNESQKALAIYKMAWCYLNLNNLPQAEKNFLSIAGKDAAGPFGYDALKDLAYVVTLQRNESDIVQFAREHFKDDKSKQSEFLMLVYSNFQAQSGTKRKPELLAELGRIEKDPVKRIRILINTLKGTQREYAANEAYQEFATLRDETEKTGWKSGLNGWEDMAIELEQELFHLIKAHVDTLSGKIKTQDNLESSLVADRLTQILAFHISYYPKSREREGSYLLWMKACEEQKKYRCAFDAANRALEDAKSTASLRRIAQLSRLRALDNLLSENPSLKPQLRQSLEQYLSERKPDADWLAIAKRLSSILNDDKKFSESIPWLEKIHHKEQSTESFYRLQFARFQAEDFAAVARANFKLGTDRNSQEARSLMRESHLKLAQKNLVGDRFEDYAQNLIEFLKTNPEADKADAARRSLVDQYLDRRMLDQASSELLRVDSSHRMRAYGPQVQSLAQLLMKKGEFAKVATLTLDWAKSPQKSALELAWAAAMVAQNPVSGIKVQDPKAREYIFGIWALTHPNTLIEDVQKTNPRSETEKKLLLLALQVSQKRLDPTVPPKLKAALKGIYEPRSAAPPARSLAEFTKIIYPSAKTNRAKYESLAQAAAEKVRSLRGRVVKDIDGRASAEQIEILRAAKMAEDRVADVLIKAPLPEGLSKDQISEYKTGIAELAAEFSKQGEEYRKLSLGLEKSASVAGGAVLLRFPSLDRWPAFRGEAGVVLESLVRKHKSAAALICLDQWKADKSITSEMYFEMRSRILFSQAANPALSRYIANEFAELGQRNLLDKWKDLALSAAKE